jgi:hypothetical protein
LCRKKENYEWRRRNKARIAAYNKKYKAENREAIAKYRKLYLQQNPEEAREWHVRNKEKVAAAKAKSYQKNRQERIEQAKRWREAHPERYRELKRAYYARNKEAINARERAKRRSAKERQAVLLDERHDTVCEASQLARPVEA